MYNFIYRDLFTKMWGDGRKNPEREKETKEKKQGRTLCGQVAWIYSDEIPRSSEKVDWNKGWDIKNREGKILEANN